MFYSGDILAKKGALSKVWLAAHWDRKLTKTQIYQTDIPQAVGKKNFISSFFQKKKIKKIEKLKRYKKKE